MATTVNNNTNATVTTITIAAQKATVEAEYKALIAGIQTELTADTSFTINKTTFTKAELLARFQARLDAAENTKTNRTALHLSVASEQAIALEVAPLRMGFKTFLQSRFGKSAPDLQKFGFKQNKTPQRPVAGKAAGIAKNQATRKARNTVGKKARLKIKGAAAAQPTPPAPPRAPATAPGSTT